MVSDRHRREQRFLEVIDDLVKRGCDPNQESQTKNRETALSFFIQNSQNVDRPFYIEGIKRLAGRFIPCIAEKITLDPSLIVVEYAFGA